MKTKKIQTSENVKQIISDYLGTVDYKLDVTMHGQHPVVELTYVDFKPTRVVRDYLVKNIENLDLQHLQREYSHEAIHDACDEIIADGRQLYVIVKDSSDMQPVTLYDIVDEMLYFRNIDL